MKNDLLACRHIGISEKDEEKMLRKIGVGSLDELIDKTIPANIRLKEPLALPAPMTEYEFGQHITRLACKNKLYTTYIGLGWYNTITPAVIQRNVFENPVWYTSYTPYQTEVSQGRLEALMNFQTAVCDLTGMPLANCSLLDEATAAAEAVSMMYALRPRDMQKSGANVVFVDESIFPQTLAVMTTRAIPQDLKFRGEETTAEIGNNNTIRENVTINRGTAAKGKTIVGSNNLLMEGVHVAHDAFIGNGCIIGNSTKMAGEIVIDDNSIISANVLMHQFCHVGGFGMIQGGCRFSKDIPPYIIAGREPICYAGINIVGLRRRGFSNETIEAIHNAYRIIYQSGLNNTEALKKIENEMEMTPEISYIVNFIRESARGIIPASK